LVSVRCVGDAAPTPNWTAYEHGSDETPSACAISTIDPTVDVVTFARSFTPASSWRASAGWSGRVLPLIRVDVDASYSLGTHETQQRNLNLRADPQALLPDEAGRPLWVSPAAIQASSGAIDLAGNRRFAELGVVSHSMSNLQSRTTAVNILLMPARAYRHNVYAMYGFTTGRDQANGFDASTTGDPRSVEWMPSPRLRRHTVSVGTTLRYQGATLDVYGRFQSGAPFTPLVAGDVNGDGLSSNDRAFVFDSTQNDARVAGALEEILRRPSSACIGDRHNRFALSNRCHGPWTAVLNTDLSIPAQTFGLPKRVSLNLSSANLPAAVDRMFHGSRTHGWGGGAAPDPFLYRVSGFDQAAGRFNYTSNPGFGRALPAQAVGGAPFRISFSARVALGQDPDRQLLGEQLRRVAAMPGTPDAARLREYLGQGVPNVPVAVLRLRDSLVLTPEQVRLLGEYAERFRARQAELWQPLASYLEQLQLDYSSREAVERYRTTNTAAFTFAADLAGQVRQLLSDYQISQLPSYIRDLFNRELLLRRMRNRF
jgi:hypothetical protein